VIHVYALTSDPVPGAQLTGIDEQPVTEVACGPLHAAVTEHQRAPRATRETALAHAETVAALAEITATLPMRFGVQHADVARLREAVAGAREELLRGLEQVGDAAEFVVRLEGGQVPDPPATTAAATTGATGEEPATEPDPTAEGVGPGHAYLAERLAEHRARATAYEVALAELRRASADLDPLAREVVERPGPRGPERCFLVWRAEAEVFADAAAAAVEGLTDGVWGGPWPPYTFVTEVVA
jgi:hypothetical protein